MNTKRALPVMLLLPLLATAGGCATHALWTKADLDNCNLPARNINLRLFQTGQPGEFLVVYDEYSERHDSVRPRAYLLNQNQNRIAQQEPPSFVKLKSIHSLTPIPIFQEGGAPSVPPPPVLYAVLSTNSQSFTLFSGGRAAGTYALPVYNDGKGRMERIALTPVAATADLTIVGGFLGCLYLDFLCESNGGFHPGFR